jgi:hypothetical protein
LPYRSSEPPRSFSIPGYRSSGSSGYALALRDRNEA